MRDDPVRVHSRPAAIRAGGGRVGRPVPVCVRDAVPGFRTGAPAPVPMLSTALSTGCGPSGAAGRVVRRGEDSGRVAFRGEGARSGGRAAGGRDSVADSYNGYCVKCKEKRDFDGEVKVSESGRRMAQGTCPVCGTKMNRILGKA